MKGSPRLTTPQIATFMVWLSGGHARRVDTEEIANLCWQYAPSRFAWDRYPEFPDKDKARWALLDAKKHRNGALVEGENKVGWLLTEQGINWVRDNEFLFRDFTGRQGRSVLSRSEDSAVEKLAAHPLFDRWKSGKHEASRYDVADTAGLTADAPRVAVERRLTEFEKLAALRGEEELRGFVQWLRDQLNN